MNPPNNNAAGSAPAPPPPQLTQGAVRHMVDNLEGSRQDSYRPALQVINLKPVTAGNDRFRVSCWRPGVCVAPSVCCIVVVLLLSGASLDNTQGLFLVFCFPFLL
jgi:hypothetical protein